MLFYNGREPLFPMPFFDGVTPADLLPATPFEIVVETAWHMVGANAFDLQHFRLAHDRTLVGEPIIDTPSLSHDASRQITTSAGSRFAINSPGDSPARRCRCRPRYGAAL